MAAVAGFAVLGLAGPALAHVEVSADKKTAGAENVTLTFHGEGERDNAGIKAERVVLPDGIDPASVTLVSAPAGWAFARTADGFTVAGKALGPGDAAVWKVKIAKLPDGETRLSFKTLETYSSGEIERWIEIQEPGAEEPDNPAPLITLKPGPSTAPAAPSAAPSTEAPSTTASAPAAAVTTTPTAAEPADEGGSTWWIWLLLAAVVVIAAVLVLARRRRAP